MNKILRGATLLAFAGVASFAGVSLVTGSHQVNHAIGRRVLSLTTERMGEAAVSRTVLAGMPTLVYIFDEKCQLCRTQAPGWRRLAGRVAGEARVVAISTAALGGAMADSLLRGSAIEYLGASTSARLGQEFGVRGVPTTILIDNKQRIREVRGGVQSELSLAELYDHVRTPQ